jgi:plasmid stability protein
MPSVTIRDIPNDVRDELAERAARSGRSLQQYLWDELTTLAARPDIDTLLAQVRRRKQESPVTIDVTELLGWRDSDRA